MKYGSTRKPKGNSLGESVLTSRRCLIARELGEPLEMGKQKTATRAGALIDDAKKWKSTDWNYLRRQVRRLQVRIAKGCNREQMEQGKSPAISLISLVLRQVTGCETGDLQ